MDGQAAQLRHIILMLRKGGTALTPKKQSMDGQAAQLRHIILMLSKGAAALTRNNSP
jgi:hypothetical protein